MAAEQYDAGSIGRHVVTLAPQAAGRYLRCVPLESDQRDWDELGSIDPEWAILSDAARKDGGWDRDEFLATGPRDIAEALERFAQLPSPSYGIALDFGCGLGRLTRALAGPFGSAVGVDISPSMVNGAERMNADLGNVSFAVNDRADLTEIAEDGSFDLVFSFIALQHVSSREAIASYITDFVRILRPGGLVAFQLPSWISPIKRIQPKRHMYRALRGIGVPTATLHGTLQLHPMAMRFLPVDEVLEVLTSAGAEVTGFDTAPPHDDFPGYRSTNYYATK